MLLMALDSDAGRIHREHLSARPRFSSFKSVWTEDYWLMEHFWHQFANSIYLGVGRWC